MFSKKCLNCGGPILRVIHTGLPGRLCEDEECSTLWGPARWISLIIDNGIYFTYEGSYFRGLLEWLRTPAEAGDEEF